MRDRSRRSAALIGALMAVTAAPPVVNVFASAAINNILVTCSASAEVNECANATKQQSLLTQTAAAASFLKLNTSTVSLVANTVLALVSAGTLNDASQDVSLSILKNISTAQGSVTADSAQTITDAPIFIADKKRYFQEEGLAVSMPQFASAANMVAPLGAGLLVPLGGESLPRTPSKEDMRGMIRAAIFEVSRYGKVVLVTHAASMALAVRIARELDHAADGGDLDVDEGYESGAAG